MNKIVRGVELVHGPNIMVELASEQETIITDLKMCDIT